jgi:tetratricopeptide (TPR) repeat protein
MSELVNLRKDKATVTMDDVRDYLATQEKTALVELLMQHATENDRFRQLLLLRAAKKSPKGIDVSSYRRAIAAAVDTGDFVEYRAAYGYAQGIENVIDSIDELLREGHAGEVVELTEHALAEVEGAAGSVDDSDGHMGEVLERLQELHLMACRKAKPDPEQLAKRLCEWELRTDSDVFFGAAERYAKVLGQRGIAVYRRLAEAEWAKVPVLGPRRAEGGDYARHFRITHVMETLARQAGDVEALVAIKQRDLSLAYSYLQIAETYKAARKHDQALEWAERGVKAFPKRTDSRLREFLAGEYHRRKRHDDAMALIWADFTESPVLDRYRMLKDHADRIGRWDVWRAKAIAYLRESIAAAGNSTVDDRSPWTRRTDRSELVRIFLWERNANAAWSEAVEGGCSNDLWMDLAGKREKEHPEDALPVYQRQLEPTLSRKNNDAYRAAVRLLRQIRDLMDRLGREAEFTRYLESVRTGHKAKRNFIKLLDHARWA